MEIKILVYAVYYVFYGIYLFFKHLFLFIYRGGRWIVRRFADESAAAAGARKPPPMKLASRASAAKAARPAPAVLASVTLARALSDLAARADEEAARCVEEEQNERFADTLSNHVAKRARAAAERLRTETPDALQKAERTAADLSFVFTVTAEMAAQRRDADKLLLLGDADALAEACYRPLFEFARGSGVRLRSSRAATFMGDKDIAIFLGFLPVGLAPIVLPSAWATEIGWWPAIAHEIGHDFHASVVGLDAELRQRLRLPPAAPLPRPDTGLLQTDVDAAYAAWLSEIFADAFGTLMLGAAYVTTMMWSFADPKNPASVTMVDPAADASGNWVTYDEHPPAHLRVVLACRLLSAIGFPREAEALEDEWRRRHKSPESLAVPTLARSWYRIHERPYVAYGERLVEALYLSNLSALGGVALRSIPGLDLGPREHQAALDARDAFFLGQPAPTRDPRCLIAGAVLAWKDRPALAARVLRAARATIPAVGVSKRQLRLRAARDDGAGGEIDPGAIDAALWRDAFLLGEALAPPAGSRLLRRL